MKLYCFLTLVKTYFSFQINQMAMRGEKTKEHEGTRGTMFNDRVVQTFKRLVYLEQITQSVLCEWKHDKFIVTKSKRKICQFYFGVGLTLLYITHLCVQFALQLHRFSNLVDFFWTILWMLYFFWSFGNYANLIAKQKDAVAFYRGMVTLDTHFAGILSPK